MKFINSIIGLTLAVSAAPAAAQDDAAGHWRALTTADVEAAYRMLREDHPGAAPEAGDEAFRARLAEGYETARARAAQVASYDGYVWTLAGFAVGMGDKHIWSRPLYVTDRPEWPGLILARRGRDFVVVDESDAAEGAPLKGARLVSCDGVSADRLADERLGRFRVVRGIEAQLIQRSAWLLVEEGNPFLKRPQSCDFSQDGAIRTVPLKWRSLWRHDYFARLGALPTRGSAGFGVRKVGDGYWIAVQSFSEKAVPVVEEVRARTAELRSAPYVVLDLRGNGGGNSLFGDQIAEALLGQPYVRSVAGGDEDDGACGKVWRVSERNLKQVEYYKNELGPKMGAEAAEGFAEEYGVLAEAKAAGRPFTGKARCDAPAKPPRKKPRAKPDYAGRIILLTDNICFSSCLIVTEKLRRLGALHVGQETDANTHYMEVREDKLPSGLSMFSTLQAMNPASPLQMGPFTPTHLFEGNIADTAALEAWVAGLASQHHTPS